mmetsp:Transcript_26197/g.74472  ORF Transcript_26197/g.74472 Transcript_26197/m.74472 type:complete len:332 (+) Transcript_26197:109-1104(+)
MGIDRGLSSEEQLDAAVSELVGPSDQELPDGDGERRGASDDEALYPTSRGARRHDVAESDMGNPLATLMHRGVQTSRAPGELTTAFGAPARAPFSGDRLPHERGRQATWRGAFAALSIGMVVVVGVYLAAPTLMGAFPTGALRGGVQPATLEASSGAAAEAASAPGASASAATPVPEVAPQPSPTSTDAAEAATAPPPQAPHLSDEASEAESRLSPTEASTSRAATSEAASVAASSVAQVETEVADVAVDEVPQVLADTAIVQADVVARPAAPQAPVADVAGSPAMPEAASTAEAPGADGETARQQLGAALPVVSEESLAPAPQQPKDIAI